MKPTIVFVDDEPHVLNGLRRSLRAKRADWDMQFLAGGVEALRFMAANPIDVVVSDMRMPDIDGASVMEGTRQLAPSAVRYILSGQAERDATYRTIGCSHRFLAKPTDTSAIIEAIDTALSWRTHPDYDVSSWSAEHLSQLACCDQIYRQLARALDEGDPQPGDIADLIERDPSLTFSLLQLVNTAYFGPGRSVLRARDALDRLGVSTLQALVRDGRFAGHRRLHKDEASRAGQHDSAEPQPHELASAAYCLAKESPESAAHADLAFACGLLMRLGARVMAGTSTQMTSQDISPEVLPDISRAESSAAHAAECGSLGDVPPRHLHTPIAAYVCTLAGLPQPLCDALSCLAVLSRTGDVTMRAATIVQLASRVGGTGHPGGFAGAAQGGAP